MPQDAFETKYKRLLTATSKSTDSGLADALGIRPSSVAGARKRGLIPGDWIEKIALDYSVNADWLLFGRGTMKGGNESVQPMPGVSQEEIPQDEDDLIRIPMADAILSAGTGSLETSGNLGREYAFRRDFIQRKGNPANMVLMRVAGDSMAPEVLDKDVVLLDQSRTHLRPGPIFAVGFEDAIYLKRVDKLPGQIILRSANPAYEPVYIDMGEQTSEQFRVIGQVLWVGREYK